MADAIAEGLATAALKTKMLAQEAERRSLEAALAELDADAPPPVELHPRLADHYAAQVAELQAVLDRAAAAGLDAEPDRALVDVVRGLVERIVIRPLTQARGGPVELTLHGDLARFILPSASSQPEPLENERCGALVAGGRIELPTCGL